MRQKRTTKTVGMDASAEDLRMIEMLKTRLRRRSNADLLRFLIQQEAERITAPVIPTMAEVRRCAK